MIDSIIVLQDLLGDLAVALIQRIHGALERLFSLSPKQEYTIA
jgi:hypothetical protein